MGILDNYYGEGMSIREKIEDLERKVKSQLSLLTTTRNTLSKFVEENKRLNENVERYKKHYLADEEYLECQDSAIKKLKKDLAYERTMLDNVKAEYENLQEINEKLNERIKELEERLDNKEKVNKQLREELGKLVMKE